MSKKIDDILLLMWAMLLAVNLIILLYDPSEFNFLLTGFVFGFFIHMAFSLPLLEIKDKHIHFLNEINNKLFEEVEELTKKKLNPKKKRKKK